MSAFEDLMDYTRQTRALSGIAERLGWDQETMMPSGAAPQRAEEMGAIESVLHDRRTNAGLGEMLANAESEETDKVASAQLRLTRYDFDRAVKVPGDLAAEIARVTSLSQGIWAQARAADDFLTFAPVLENVLGLMREKADALADGQGRYDALLQGYEPGITAAEISAIFDAMRPRLVDLRERVLAADDRPGLTGEFDSKSQLAISQELASAFGYDMDHGRIDRAVHPFSSGSGLDVRITTRTSRTDPFNCFYSTIHEVGHATYEQGIDQRHLLTPIGQGVSMGVHESQSRIYENQLGRGRAFTGWLFERMRTSFGDIGVNSADDFYAAVNRVARGHIRTEADELQYNLHIMLRFDLERDLVSGELSVADLESAWNDRFKNDFGYPVDRASNGVLQDIHWSFGYFGYFPTYSLGNVYAGCLFDALREAVPDFETALAQGDPGPATKWLRENVQVYGGLRPPKDTIAHATGKQPSEEPLLAYLENKFGALYGL